MASKQGVNDRLRQLTKKYAEKLQLQLGNSLVTVALFGSVARSEATPFSDIDILLIIEGLPRGRFARMDLLKVIDDEIDPILETLRKEGIFSDICPILKTPEEAQKLSPLYLDMVEDAEIFYDRDNFFFHILKKLKDSLKRLGARRRRQGKCQYWELKPDYKPGEVFEI